VHNNVVQHPQATRYTSGHGKRHAQRFVDVAEVMAADRQVYPLEV
jgi:hypothetical protein